MSSNKKGNKKACTATFYEGDVDQLPDENVVMVDRIPIVMQLFSDLQMKIGGRKATAEETRTAILYHARKSDLPFVDLQRVNDILIGKQNSDKERLQILHEITNVTVRCIHLVTRKTIM
jgi:hypothetical protein